MPVVKTKIIRTMRDIWDKDKKALNVQKEGRILAKRERRLTGFEKEGLAHQSFSLKNLGGQAKTQKYFLEHLELKKVIMDFFPDYQRYLGDAGFTKI